MRTNSVDNADDTISFRAVLARIDDLLWERDQLDDAVAEATANVAYHHGGEVDADGPYPEQKELREALNARDDWAISDEAEELRTLEALRDQVEDYAGRDAELVRDSYFKRYAQNYAEDIGAIDSSASWPHSCIDWDEAADELQGDYTSVDFDGVTYWVR